MITPGARKPRTCDATRLSGIGGAPDPDQQKRAWQAAALEQSAREIADRPDKLFKGLLVFPTDPSMLPRTASRCNGRPRADLEGSSSRIQDRRAGDEELARAVGREGRGTAGKRQGSWEPMRE